jgi:TonB family protein
MPGMKSAVLACALVAGIAGVIACATSAQAATEFCPAQLTGPYTKTNSRDATLHYYYHLQALGPRSVEGTIIADTDHGWFTWVQQPVQVTRMTYTRTAPLYTVRYVVAESPELDVSFPIAVNIRRLWLASAKTNGDAYFGWDAHGTVVCTPPDFVAMYSRSRVVTKRTPQTDDPTPGPAPPTAVATATAAPFPETTCAHPFVAATVSHAVQPDFPAILRDQDFSQVATAVVYVAVDSAGKLADAWIYASSGYPAIDKAALSAARRSSYVAPISYCRAVSGTYLFQADFSPY